MQRRQWFLVAPYPRNEQIPKIKGFCIENALKNYVQNAQKETLRKPERFIMFSFCLQFRST